MASSNNHDQKQLSESLIVALAALHDLVGDFTLDDSQPLPLTELFPSSPDQISRIDGVINKWLSEIPEDRFADKKPEVQGRLRRAIASHRANFKNDIVKPETIDRFRQMASRIVVR